MLLQSLFTLMLLPMFALFVFPRGPCRRRGPPRRFIFIMIMITLIIIIIVLIVIMIMLMLLIMITRLY